MEKEYSLRSFCRQQGAEKLLAEWDTEKNAPLTPDDIHKGSHKKVWWHCDAGHSWQAEVRVRTSGAQCPYCAGRVLWTGSNDLAAVDPALAAQWDPEKNGTLTPEHVLPGSGRYAWWRCEKGHSWRASIRSRSRGNGCPVCSGRSAMPGETDLATMFPELAEEWDTVRNGKLTPDRVAAYSNRKVWWRCALGHEWQAVIASRTASRVGCPYCSGRRVLAGFNDLATLQPETAAQWDDALNGKLTPEMVTLGSHKKVWWRCGDGHVWKAAIFSRTGRQKCGCPICAGKLRQRTACERLAKPQ